MLLDFIDGPAQRARSLFILGDLFETWIGDDAATDPAPEVAQYLKALAASGVAINFIVGNRDFLLGDDYCRQAGMTRLQEPYLLKEISPPALLMHGDTLCTDDLAYQRFRRKVRNNQWQRRILSRPIWWRRMLARLARLISRYQNRNKAAAIMDANSGAVIECMRTHGVGRLIHGHTHRPAIHAVTIDGRPGQRIVLGDWHGEQGSVVRLESGRVELLKVARGENGEIEFEIQAVGQGAPDYSVESSK